MKRFLLFSNIEFYPNGGWGDFGGDFDSISEAQEHAKKTVIDEWFEIVDTRIKKIISTATYENGKLKWEYRYENTK